MGCSEGSDAPASRQSRSPLPGALELDEAIERRLAEFDAVPFDVRRTAWILAALVQKLTPAGVLQVLGFAHLVARDDHR
jgi:hypothetical protein